MMFKKMIPKVNKFIDVIEVFQSNNNASIVCKVSEYKNILKRIEIGESITTTEPFQVEFPDFTSKWILIFYPKGQYDFGLPSENCRAYIKMISGNNEMFKMSIIISIQSQSSNVEAEMTTSDFVLNDIKKHWAGPFQMESIKEDDLVDSLTIQCSLEVIQNESNENNKRMFVDVSPMQPLDLQTKSAKKNRVLSPEVKVRNSSDRILENKEIQPNELPKPKFSYRATPRKLIFSPKERAEVKKKYDKRPPTPFRVSPKLTERCDKLYNEYLAPNFKGSNCLKVSDLALDDRVDDNQETLANKNEKTSETDEDGDRRMDTINKRISFFNKKANSEK